ncbi:MAG: NADH-quinone oxidoreductase subunit A [Elusimicrobia bacterium]|nr:NADH-quinone oxidoreductase subunit A [Elusimicrobiota bacterium]
MTEYIGLVIFLAISAVVAGGFLLLASCLGRKRPSAVKSEPFECGQEPFALPSGRFHVHFYLIAILFILFDVELVFLYPWAVVCTQLGAGGFAALAVFLGILMAGFYYALDNGALDWE